MPGVPPDATSCRFKVTPSCSPTTLDALLDDDPWVDAVERYRARNPRRLERLDAYARLLDAGEHRRIAEAVLASTHVPGRPRELWRNKADGRKKLVFRYEPGDELLFRVLNRLLQPAAEAAASRWCRSFLPGGGARAAVGDLAALPGRVELAAARFDVRDYFNSIDVDDLLARLPLAFSGGPVGALLGAALLPRPRAGVRAGTPLAPLLATLYLADVDDEVAAGVTAYRRYSDDIVLVGPVEAVAAGSALVRARLAERGLAVNEGKSSVAAPGEPWDYLGFRFGEHGVGLAPVTVRKFRAKSTRLARGLLRWRETKGAGTDRTTAAFLRSTNRRLYGVPDERARFSWATWFLPVLEDPEELRPLDEHVRREARYAATGRRTASARAAVPHDALVAAGHLPLVAAWWAGRQGRASYDALVAARTGLGAAPAS
jgi:hypothetical protein